MELHQEKLWSKKFILVTLCNLLLFLNLQMLLSSFPLYVKETFHASNFTVSLVTSLFALSAIVTRFFAAGALEKGKMNQLLFLGLGIAALSTAGYYWCGAISALLFMRMAYGVGFGIASTTLPTMAVGVIPLKRLGEGIGYFGLSTSLAMSIGPVIGLTLLDGFGFGTLVTVAAVIAVLTFPLAYFNRSIVSSGKKTVAEPSMEPGKTNVSKKKTTFVDRKLLLPAFLHLLLAITYGGLLSFLALFGKEARINHIGNFFLCNAIAIFVVRPFAGKIFDRKGPFAVLIPGAFLTIAGLTILSVSHTISVVTISALVYGLGYGMIQPSLQAWMIKEVSPEKRGMANGLFFNSLDLGIAVGAMLLGVIATGTSYSTMYQIAALFMIIFLVIYVISIIRKNVVGKTSMR